MTLVNVTFDYPNVKGTLQIDMTEDELSNFSRKRGYYQVETNDSGPFYMEIGESLENSMTIQQVHELPTEEGLYLDTDGGVWRLDDLGNWKHLSPDGVVKQHAGEWMPFTELKLGRTY